MSGEHAEIALDAGDVDLIDLAGESEFFRRDEIEMEGGHGDALSQLSLAGLTRGSIEQKTSSQMDCRVKPGNDNLNVKPLRPRASCPFRPPLRWCRPCRRPLPADDRTCLRRSRGSP